MTLTNIPRLMLLEALAFAIASVIHSGTLTDVSVDPGANIAEGTIAAVLFVGAVLIILQPAWTRIVGALAQGFALLGSLIGTYLAFRGLGPNTVPDLVFHVAVVVTLAFGMLAALRDPGVAGSRSADARSPARSQSTRDGATHT